MSSSTPDELENARQLVKVGRLAEAEAAYQALLSKPAGSNEKIILIQELGLNELGTLYRDNRYVDVGLLSVCHSLTFATVKSRNLLD